MLIQHYETEGARVKDLFEVARRKHGKPAARVLSAYGHTHDQGCHRHNAESGQCELIMTGGGGGCCRDGAAKLVNGGFTAVHLTADGGFVSDVDSEEVKVQAEYECVW